MDIADKAEGIIRVSLAEDLGSEGDITTRAVCRPGDVGKGQLVCGEPCTLAGQPVADRVFALAGPGASYRQLVQDGDSAAAGQVIGEVEGPLVAVLSGERTALNFLCHLSGIATLTARLVAMAAPHGVKIMDTRKTTPGLRVLEKYAVSAGGGTNHRVGLYDGVIIKDNHIAAAGGIPVAVRRARNALGDELPLEVEASTLAEVRQAVDSGADIIMLDNMSPGQVEKAVAIIGGRAKVEVSGGMNPDNIGSYLGSGIDFISLGFITHSAPPVDISLRLVE
ncbi:MAG: carboxylating nicotinate-nucleotide diphosphorylase [Actinobacteria bacterium]|nr:carboxylating nicotinate-nucleotide diphosphorylase [Actinomycetota bacterium]